MRLSLAHLLTIVGLVCASSAEAATYYVRNGGSDSADGRSHATAWASLSKVNGYSFAAGDRVLFHEGHRWVGQLTVDWAGTSSERAVVGAYYLDANAPVQGYRTARPIIDGEDRLPSGAYGALVSVRANRVRVENLSVLNSEGRGISVADLSDAEIIGCVVSNTYDGGIHFLRAQGSRAENNLVTHSDIGHHEDGRNWNAAIAIVSSTSTVVRNNTVSEVWGEGINANHGSNHTLIERNYVYGVRAVGIYLDSSTDLTVRRNIVVGTANTTYWRSGSAVGAGIAINNELYHYPEGGGSLSVDVQVKRAKIYGNLVAYTTTGLSLWGALPSTSFDSTLVYNNTFVDNNTQVNMGSQPTPNSKFINNILLSLSSGTRDVGSASLSGMVARNNYFSQGDPGGDYVHAGNRFTGLRIAKMSGWRAVTSRDQISWRDFVIESGSPVIGVGDDEPRRTSDNTNDYVLDYNGAAHGAPMDMGALTFATPVRRRPMPPKSLAGT
jgi:parallel beta-helix repeat protein